VDRGAAPLLRLRTHTTKVGSSAKADVQREAQARQKGASLFGVDWSDWLCALLMVFIAIFCLTDLASHHSQTYTSIVPRRKSNAVCC